MTDSNWGPGGDFEPGRGCVRLIVAAFVVLAVLLVGAQIGMAVVGR